MKRSTYKLPNQRENISMGEVKSETGKATELQKYRIEQLTKAGFLAFVCNSFENMLHNIKNDSNNNK